MTDSQTPRTTARYYVTRFGSLCKQLTEFDELGFADFLRIEDQATCNFHRWQMNDADDQDLVKAKVLP